jgi:RecJ-like exonuclease
MEKTMAERKPCKKCKGTGNIKGLPNCPACDGWGKEGGAPKVFTDLFKL